MKQEYFVLTRYQDLDSQPFRGSTKEISSSHGILPSATEVYRETCAQRDWKMKKMSILQGESEVIYPEHIVLNGNIVTRTAWEFHYLYSLPPTCLFTIKSVMSSIQMVLLSFSCIITEGNDVWTYCDGQKSFYRGCFASISNQPAISNWQVLR